MNAVALRCAQRASGSVVAVGSGDSGVGGGDNCTQFVPTFPATSPWVTAVGGTNPENSGAASLSAGGFSNYFDRSAPMRHT